MKYSELVNETVLKTTKESLELKGYEVQVAKNGKAALETIKNLIPNGVSVMNGASNTLKQIGFVDYLKAGRHKWINIHEKILQEKDPQKQSELRKEATMSEYYLGSVHALTQDGNFVIASNTGSQLPHIVFTSKNLIFVVSTKKIVKDINEGLDRLEKHVIPLENSRMMELYGVPTNPSKILLFKDEAKIIGRTIRFILVEEDLGF